MKNLNGTMMQYFEWYLASTQTLWNDIKNEADRLSRLGITSLWLPPAYKGVGGKEDVGYGVYDVYDLGEFNQKGTIKTKYGSKKEYIECINILKSYGIETYADIVLNHKMGADINQIIPAQKVDFSNHNIETSNHEKVTVATKFTFPGRKHKYSDFEWNWTHFDGIDFDVKTGEHAIYKFKDKEWDEQVDEEFSNYDYLMGADLDFQNKEVVDECANWLKWYINLTNVDGLRLDAVKHIPAKFYEELLKTIREETKKNLFVVGEYWSSDLERLKKYLKTVNWEMSLFDVPLHYNLYQASINENYDLRIIFDNTLVKDNPGKAVTFVDNHDTQPEQALQSFVEKWFKQSAYALILLRENGYPCVFYGDLYGISHNNILPVKKIEVLMQLRKEKAYGKQHDYFDNPNIIGWTREGDVKYNKSGLAVLISNKEYGEKKMYIGEQFEGKTFIDAMGNNHEEVAIDSTGHGRFRVNPKSVSVWIQK